MTLELASIDLKQKDFQRICSLVYRLAGIRLMEGKQGLVRSRLMKRLRALRLSDFGQYMDYVQSDRTSAELSQMIDEITTNKTSFFREEQHFEYLRTFILPELKSKNQAARIWSAGCSSGEEPFSIAIALREEWRDIDQCDIRILATDLSQRVLSEARAAVYDKDSLKGLPDSILRRYFHRQLRAAGEYQVNDEVRKMVCFARLNLMDDWPMKGLFDVIFCRNVMIYFDKQTQQALVERFWGCLEKGGHLFVGHSESLSGSSHRFRYVQPATYMK
jgi:chemotaxis protein methyltransferase CheR